MINQPFALNLNLSSTAINCSAGTSTITANGSGGTGSLVYNLNGGTYQGSGTF